MKGPFDPRHADGGDHHPFGGEHVGNDLPAVGWRARCSLRGHPHRFAEQVAFGI
jgi:hypothetical protein